MNKKIYLLPICLAVLMTGCSLAPQYERPQAPVAMQWPQDEATQNAKVLTDGLQHWGTFFKDERLLKLIAQGIESNKSLMAAFYNVEAARAQYRVSRAQLLPSVAASAAESAAYNTSASNHLSPSHNYSLSASLASYELDLFGRVRNLNEQALQSYFVTEAAQRTAQMTVVTEIAQTWVALGGAKEQYRLAQQTYDSQKKSEALIEASYRLGAVSAIDLQQVKTTVASAEVALATARRSVAQYRNALQLLVGTAYAAELEPDGMVSNVTAEISAASNVPSEVLLARPDIAAAEARLKSANANIGVARANFFPRIALTGSIGTSSSGGLQDLFDSGSRFWTWSPSVSLPIFSGGANVANLEAAKLQQKAAVANYEAAIQSAFREVADALATEGTVAAELRATQDLAEASAEAFRLAQARYDAGSDSYLSLLDSQRSNFSAQQSLIRAQVSRVASAITLFKVMGGASQLEKDTK